MTHSSTPAISKTSPSSQRLTKGLTEGLSNDEADGLTGDPSASASSEGQPALSFRQARSSIWRKLYVWTWITTLVIIGATFLGFKLLPPHSFSENFSDGRPQVSVRVDRTLAILRGQIIVNSDEEVVSMIPSLLEPTEIYGLLPVRSEDGKRVWRAYRSRVPITAGRGKIVVIVSGLGLDRRVTERAIDMPAAVTLEFSPYGRSLSRWALFARERDHELLLSLPVEGFPDSGIDAGNLQLSVKQGASENIHRFKTALGRLTGYVGISTGHKSPFFSDQAIFSPILRDIATRGLLFLDVGLLDEKALSQSLRASSSRNEASRLPLAKLDLSLDQAQTREEIELALEKITSSTRGKSAATIVRFAPLPVTLEVLDEWLVLLDSSRRHQVVPFSAIFSANSGKQKRF